MEQTAVVPSPRGRRCSKGKTEGAAAWKAGTQNRKYAGNRKPGKTRVLPLPGSCGRLCGGSALLTQAGVATGPRRRHQISVLADASTYIGGVMALIVMFYVVGTGLLTYGTLRDMALGHPVRLGRAAIVALAWPIEGVWLLFSFLLKKRRRQT